MGYTAVHIFYDPFYLEKELLLGRSRTKVEEVIGDVKPKLLDGLLILEKP